MAAAEGADTSARLSADNCYELLTKAKRAGAADARERAYRYMSDNYLQVLRSPAVFGRLSAAERELILARRMEGREVLAAAPAPVAAAPVAAAAASTGSSNRSSGSSSGSSSGGSGSGEPSDRSRDSPPQSDAGRRQVFCLEPRSRRWEALTRLPEEVPPRGSAMCTMFNYLFVAGGVRTHADGRATASARVFCFNPRTGQWSETRALTQARSQLRLVCMDGHLYAVGGECLLTVERYDPRADRWSRVAPLPGGAFAVAHEAAACGGQLFVSGGSLFYRLLRYDSRRDEWEECPFNESRRRSSDMVAHRGRVYRFDVDRERASVGVHKYDTVVKAWLGGASFPLENPQPFRCAVLGERIYCVSRSQTLQFEVREDGEGFLPEVLPSPAEAAGVLVPFVLTLKPDPADAHVDPADAHVDPADPSDP